MISQIKDKVAGVVEATTWHIVNTTRRSGLIATFTMTVPYIVVMELKFTAQNIGQDVANAADEVRTRW